MSYNSARLKTIIVAVSFAIVAWPISAIADDQVPDEIKRAADPRFDIDRYSRSYTQTMGVLGKFQNKGCIDESNAGDQDKWVAYALSLAKNLHDFAGWAEHSEPKVDAALRQRQEALDMVNQLLAAAEKAKKLLACPPPLTAPAPGPEGAPPPVEPLPALKLPKSFLLLYPCATNEEQYKVRKLLAQIGELKARIDYLQADLKAAQQAFDDRDTENGEEGSRLYKELQAAKERHQSPNWRMRLKTFRMK